MYRKPVFTADYGKAFCVLPKNTSAIQIIPDGYDRIRMGTLLQLPEGARVEINGEGFDNRTVRIAWEGNCYYAFREDIEAAESYKVSAAAG
ncbi:MAG: hypothetical protein ACJ73N_17875 [Bryobacteraceae bacterium]